MRHWTRTFDFSSPTRLRVAATLGQVMCGPGGYIKVGVSRIRFRNEENDEETRHFETFNEWPLSVHRPRMTSVTFVLRLDGRRNGRWDAVAGEALLTLFFED